MKRACVIGWPIEHSRSPLIHNYWLKRYGIAGAYTKEAVRPDAAAEFLKSLERNDFAGCNVTVPLKEIAFAVADEKDAAAIAVGAANTVSVDGGRLCASNTDTYGFMTYLGQAAPAWASRKGPVSILGAGGAARAIVHGFMQAGVREIYIFNRTRAKADVLADHFGPRVAAFDWADRSNKSGDASILVNAATIGMNGEGTLGIDLSRLDPACIVCDIVYIPLETELLKTARARGLKAVDGLGMLLHQAVPGFERWFGVRPDVTDELYRLVAADIGDRRC